MTTTPPPLQLRELRVQEIEPNLSQARRYFDQATLQELASSPSTIDPDGRRVAFDASLHGAAGGKSLGARIN